MLRAVVGLSCRGLIGAGFQNGFFCLGLVMIWQDRGIFTLYDELHKHEPHRLLVCRYKSLEFGITIIIFAVLISCNEILGSVPRSPRIISCISMRSDPS